MDDIIIIGSGAAGLTAAVYALRAGKSVRVFECGTFGGQINFAPCVENYPSIKQISGSEFAANLLEQAMDLGAAVEFGKVDKVTRGENFTVTADGTSYFAKSVIIATGVKHKRLCAQNEERFSGEGVSYCAICDGAFFKDCEVAVAGGGDTAFQEAIFLSRICKKVYLIHRRDKFRAEEKLVQAAKRTENIEFILNSCVVSLSGEKALKEITLQNTLDMSEKQLEVGALFVAIGHEPQNRLFKDIVTLDANGYIDAGEDCKTQTPGVFVAGDCRKKSVRQLTTAVSDGAVAALAACSYLNN